MPPAPIAPPSEPPPAPFLSRRETAALLGVSLPTTYRLEGRGLLTRQVAPVNLGDRGPRIFFAREQVLELKAQINHFRPPTEPEAK